MPELRIVRESEPPAQLFASDARLWRALMDTSAYPIAVYSLEPDGEFRVVEANEACAPYGLVAPNAAAGMLLKDSTIPEIVEYVAPRLHQCVQTGEPRSYERAVDLPSGRSVWATNLIPVPGPYGEHQQVIAMLRPLPPDLEELAIDKRKRRVMDALMSSELNLIYIYDGRSRRVTYAGGKVFELLGISPYELEQVADPITALVHDDDIAPLKREMKRINQREAKLDVAFECRIRHRDRRFRRLCFHSKVLDRDKRGRWQTLIGIARDVTEAQLRDEVTLLNQQLASAQLSERRLVAQELHDSAGQYVIAAKLAMANLKERSPDLLVQERIRTCLEDVDHCLDDADREIRVLSYVLHAPAIANQNLATVLRNFALGFGGRSGLTVHVSIDSKVNRVHEQLSIPLLRICQEALTNVHRHAKAKTVAVTVDVIDHEVELKIKDDGIGFQSEGNRLVRSPGLGLNSMRKRVEDLGGTLVIGGSGGTTVCATFPLG